MLDLHINGGQSLIIDTPSGEIEVMAAEVRPELPQVTLEVLVPEEWQALQSFTEVYALGQEFNLQVPDGEIRIKVLRFRPRPDGTAGAVSLGIDAPRDWPIMR